MTYVCCADRPEITTRNMRMAALLAATAILLLLTGCAGPLVMTREPDKTFACVGVEWSTPKQISETCGRSPVTGIDAGACYLNGQIVARRPTGWGDEAAFVTLGHELMHALGASHD